MIYRQVGSLHTALTLVSQCNPGWFFSVLINNGEREFLLSSLFYVSQIFMLSTADPESAPDEPELVQDSSCFYSFFFFFFLLFSFSPLQFSKSLWTWITKLLFMQPMQVLFPSIYKCTMIHTHKHGRHHSGPEQEVLFVGDLVRLSTDQFQITLPACPTL